MGANQKFCKVTVHKAPPASAEPRKAERARRQTVAYGEQAEPIAMLEEPSSSSKQPQLFPSHQDVVGRRRALTTSSGAVEVIKGRVLNPLSRMTMRCERDGSEAAAAPKKVDPTLEEIHPYTNLSGSFLDVDTDESDPVRKTFAEEDANKLFAVGTPPIPTGMTVALQRNQSVPMQSARRFVPLGPTDGSDYEPETYLRHGQTLHLAFNNSTGQSIQVSGRQKRSSAAHMFSKRIRCLPVNENTNFSNVDAMRIIGHTTDSEIRGGDRISLARRDGSVLRIQKMSRKLFFSPKIDTKSKFIVCGVPEGTLVTETTKFYLQSVYDRSKTVGFLKSKRANGSGCLVMYAYRNKDDKSEPIQFFKRREQYQSRTFHHNDGGVQF
ncbi:TPA: hypothetical protein N0F65_008988 [Lagenidium giganteum]|uniref:Tubby C-terminal domain-containing protein n=1 Tax=Lagenidium giganteum TaxID=4803 RepID=A0AAV2YRI5_9STRA|nr:TPA: hypothetical protein N0F65_008988 [Lagenidium giganteum]